jgi:UDP-N-acetylglucosamine enolpyruvyl transferase
MGTTIHYVEYTVRGAEIVTTTVVGIVNDRIHTGRFAVVAYKLADGNRVVKERAHTSFTDAVKELKEIEKLGQ